MMSPNEENISGLMDDELSSQQCHETIDQLLNNSSARGCWERFHIISDTLKRNLPVVLNPGFSAGVMAALKDEPTVLAPRRRSSSSLTKRLTGFAVAASVAAIGVLGVKNLYQEDGLVMTPTQTAMQSPINASSAPPSIQLVQQGGVVHDTPSHQIQTPPPSFLNRYLVDHSQQTARGVQGVIPYARIVTYPAEENHISRAQK